MKHYFAVLSCIFLLLGCSETAIIKLSNVRDSFANNDFIESAEKFSGGEKIETQDNLELLITGLNQFQAGDFNLSDAAFEEFNHRNIDLTGGNFTRELSILFGGEMSVEYRPLMMDSLFVSYYQIWDAIGAGRKSDVRVIINQSYNRQQEMSRQYKELIEKNEPKIDETNSELYSELAKQNAKWGAYRDIMNPALMYLSGIWFLNNSDFSDAQTYLERAYGMNGQNDYIYHDLNFANKKMLPKNITWVFVESGFAPKLISRQINLPVITNNGIVMASVAVSEPVFFNAEEKLYNMQLLADIDKMFMTEFGEYRINNALREWGGAVARVIAQSIAYNSDSKYASLFGLGATIFSLATTNAEVRSWVTLPKNIYVMRDKTDVIEKYLNKTLKTDIVLDKQGNNLIYVRLTGGKPVIHTFKI